MNITEGELSQWLQSIVSVAALRYRNRDISGLRRAILRFDSMLGEVRTDPHLGRVETAIVQSVLLLAETHLDQLDFTECIGYCEDARRILTEKAIRYLRSDEAPRRDSPSWCALLTVLGDAKWKGPASLEHVVLPVSAMVERYEEIQLLVESALTRYPLDDDSRRADLRESLIWCGINVLKTTRRYADHLTDRIQRVLLDSYGPQIGDHNQPYYWNLYVADLYLSGKLDSAEYERANEMLREVMQQLKGPQFSLRAFERASQNEKLYLLSNPLSRARVLGASLVPGRI